MKFKKILVLYKRSAYHIYFKERKAFNQKLDKEFKEKELARFRDAHDEHYQALRSIGRVLLSHGIRYDEAYRGRGISYNKYDLIITIGGDGTFLEASRHVKNQVVLGINSAPNHSVGRFCLAHAKDFEKVLTHLENNQYKIGYFHRLELQIGRSRKPVQILNDALICHTNPAVLCRYYIQIGQRKEEQRSSGVWVSTAAGSTGAIHSAGGKILPSHDKLMQYKVRELYRGKEHGFQLTGDVLDANDMIEIRSLMRRGVIYVDGAHVHFPFEYGVKLSVKLSAHPLKTILI